MSLPWFKCYPTNLRDGMVGLTPEERGCYVTVLTLIYERAGPIPDDDAWLAGHCWTSVRVWKRVRAALLVKHKLFAVNVDGVDRLMNRRAAEEIAETRGLREARSEAGIKGGLASARNRTRKCNENNVSGQASASANDQQEATNQEARASQDIVDSKKGSVSPPNGEDTGAEAPVDPNGRAWDEAVGVLVGQGGMSADKARSFFGKLLSANALEARDLLGPLGEAFNLRTADPQGFLTKAAQARGRKRQTGPPKRVSFV